MFSKFTTTVLVALVAGLSGLHVVEAFTCSSGLYTEPKCCSALVLNIFGLDCTTYIPKLGDCSGVGKTDYCCFAPFAGQALLCQFIAPEA